MSQAELAPERVIKIKEKMVEKKWTKQNLVDKTLEAGGITSLSTVKRVCREGSEQVKFRPETLQPLEAALGISDKAPTAALSPATEDIYKTLVKELRLRIKDLEQGNRVRNAAVIVLLAVQLAWLIIDLMMPSVGWYRTGDASGWIVKATLFLVFFGAAVIIEYSARKAAKEKEQSDDM